MAADQIRLQYAGKPLADSTMLSLYGITNESTLESFVDWNAFSSSCSRRDAPPSTSANVSLRVITGSKEKDPGGRVKGTMTSKTDDTYECLALKAWEELGVNPLRYANESSRMDQLILLIHVVTNW
jgi:hypothetical protein